MAQKKPLKLIDIIRIADEAYPDGRVLEAHEKGKAGDGLAEFIARELKDTFNPKASRQEQLDEAAQALALARSEIEAVACHFASKRDA